MLFDNLSCEKAFHGFCRRRRRRWALRGMRAKKVWAGVVASWLTYRLEDARPEARRRSANRSALVLLPTKK